MQKHPNFRMTRQRQVILEELRKVNTHPSADEVYEMVRKRLPRISLGTVYRNLEVLSESGQIKKLEPRTLKRFDGNSSEHFHIRCIDLADMTPIEYQILGHRLEFFGLCPYCSNSSKTHTNRS